LTAGYELAEQSYDPARINRVVLISDGGANAGVTDIDIISAHAGGNGEDGIYMVGVGVGDAGSYHDDLMDRVTDAGKGASVFVATDDEAWSVFGANFVNTLAVAARDVQVQLELPPGFEIVKFSGEEYSTDPAEVEPQHLAPNDAMVFHQRIATCAPELIDEAAQVGITVRYKDPITFEAKEASRSAGFAELLDGDHALLLKGAAVFAYAEALKLAKNGVPEESQQARDEALAAVARAEAALPGDADLAEIRTVLTAL
jgi:Ca-activated chloride channel family protein